MGHFGEHHTWNQSWVQLLIYFFSMRCSDSQPVPPVEWKQRGVGRRAVALNGMDDGYVYYLLLDLPTMDGCNGVTFRTDSPKQTYS